MGAFCICKPSRTTFRVKRRAVAGFTIFEALLALVMSGILFSVVTVAVSAYRVALRANGAETFSGKAIAINPSDICSSAATVLGCEMKGLAMHSDFTLLLNVAATGDSLLSKLDRTILAGHTKDELMDASVLQTLLAADGVSFERDGGFSLLFFSGNLEMLGALIVSSHQDSTSGGESFVIYKVDLYGPADTGAGLLYSYTFASPGVSAQSLVQPFYTGSAISITLPDPSVPTDRPDGTAVAVQSSKLTHEIPSNIF